MPFAQVAPRYGNSNILVYILICSLIGSLSVLGCKGFGLGIKETIEGKRTSSEAIETLRTGNNQMTNALTYFWLISIVVCVAVWVIARWNTLITLLAVNWITSIAHLMCSTLLSWRRFIMSLLLHASSSLQASGCWRNRTTNFLLQAFFTTNGLIYPSSTLLAIYVALLLLFSAFFKWLCSRQ